MAGAHSCCDKMGNVGREFDPFLELSICVCLRFEIGVSISLFGVWTLDLQQSPPSTNVCSLTPFQTCYLTFTSVTKKLGNYYGKT